MGIYFANYSTSSPAGFRDEAIDVASGDLPLDSRVIALPMAGSTVTPIKSD
jgi:hypothetical protein